MKYLRILTTAGAINTDPAEDVQMPLRVYELASFNVTVNGVSVTINPQHIVTIAVVEE